jgi:DNA-binding response OmpR family regulator
MGRSTNTQKSVLNGKRVLAVDDKSDVLTILKEEIRGAAPTAVIDTARSYQEAVELFVSWTYDLAILGIMGVRGFELLEMATSHPDPMPVVMLTARTLAP